MAAYRVRLSQAATRPLTLPWAAGRPGNVTPGEDYPAAVAGQLTFEAGTTAETPDVHTLDDRRMEPPVTLVEIAGAPAMGRIKDDDTEQARKRSLGRVLAGVAYGVARSLGMEWARRWQAGPAPSDRWAGRRGVVRPASPSGRVHLPGLAGCGPG